MIKRLILILAGLAVGLAGLATVFYHVEKVLPSGSKQNPKISAAKSERMIVQFKNDRELKRVAKRAGLKPVDFVKKANGYYYVIAVNSQQKAIIERDPAIALAEVDEPVHIFLIPNDSQYAQQPNWGQVNAPAAWDITTGSSATIVAVIDTGINGQHEDLLGRAIAGYDFVNSRAINAGDDSDDHGHGTQVAGIIAATGNNNKGIAGADWSGKIMPLKALDSTGVGSTAAAADAIRYAADNGARVINLSFGRSTNSSILEDAVNYAWGKGVVIVAASGNDGVASVSFPAAFSNVIGVGALDGETRASFSNYGPELDVVAPGKSIVTAKDSQTEYSTVSGTSLAAPHVAGEVALIRGIQPNLSTQDVKAQIETQVDKLSAMGGSDQTNEYGKGRVNFEKALKNLTDYSYSVVGQNSYPTLQQGESYQFRITLKNTGGATWRRSVVHLGTNGPQDRVPSFIRDDVPGGNNSGWASENRVSMQEVEVSTGQNATFVFWYTVPSNKSPGVYREYFRPVADSFKWLDDVGIYWDIKVLSEAEKYQSQWVTQNANPTLSRGQSYKFIVQFKNTGRATWQRGQVNLGTDRGMDHIVPFLREDSVTNQNAGWLSENRIKMDQASVSPGETATFSFWMSAPSNMTPGTYRQYFRLVAERITWLEDYGVYWDVTVQ